MAMVADIPTSYLVQQACNPMVCLRISLTPVSSRSTCAMVSCASMHVLHRRRTVKPILRKRLINKQSSVKVHVTRCRLSLSSRRIMLVMYNSVLENIYTKTRIYFLPTDVTPFLYRTNASTCRIPTTHAARCRFVT